ncbi:hypothetical protein Gohar_011278 [Gossypium harknessii]|uniref:Nodulation-signaling pathway 2 protein-like n=1 Tax=Gossypium harknessii TaxID=34285 RepID=A0A7J9GTG2_9ROSI|nr:hypothetical protein [Gossypium harknessii]
MMQSDNFPPSSWPFESFLNSSIDQFEVQPYGLNMSKNFDGCEFSSSFNTREDSPEISHFSTLFSGEIFPCNDHLQEFLVPLEGLESMLTDGIEDLYDCLDEGEDSFGSMMPLSSQNQDVCSPSASIRSSEASADMTSTQSSLTLPGDSMEIDNQLSLFHLLKAYGEATEKNQSELAEVILRCVGEKASPVGETWERIAFNLSQDIQHQSDYLMQESSKNFEAAFRVFYQVFPYWRFAHFAANSAILEAMPNDADTLHIVDFNIGEGLQWPPVIEALAWKHKSMRLTSIRWEKEDSAHSPRRFKGTMRQLCNHAKSFGLKLEVEEMGIHDLVNELKMKKRGGAGEWLAFNCMVGMGKGKRRKIVNEFLNVAKEVLASSGNYFARDRGVITFGDGDACEKLKDCSGFGTFFNGQLMHYQAVLESMESNFAKHLVQARMAMECLFVGPNICGQAWLQKWKEINEICDFDAGTALEGLRVSSERLMEAKEIVRERDTLFEVSIGGVSGNELALEWRGNTLVRVSSWRNTQL